MIIKNKNNKSDRLILDKDYEAISLIWASNSLIGKGSYSFNVRIMDEYGIVIICDLKDFAIIDNSISSTWVMKGDDDYYTLQPRQFNDAFWENFFNDDPDTVKIFLEVYPQFKGLGFNF